MAYAISRSKISEEASEIIRKKLMFKPEVPNSRYNQGNSNKDPILFFSRDGDIIHLPFLFSAALFKICPNMDILYPSTNLSFTGSLRENQIAVENEAWVQLETYGTSTLGLYPGFGKTILGAKLASRAKLMTVVLVHREVLCFQWKKTFEDFTNAKVWIVGEKNPPPICDVIICMDTRWHLLPPKFRDTIGFLIIDEAHAFCTPTHVGCLLAFHPKYILVESASLERDDKLEEMVYAIAGIHGVFRDYNLPFTVLKINTGVAPVRKMTRFGNTDYNALLQNTLYDPLRNQIILDLVLHNSTFKILILTSLVDHALLLHNSLLKMGITSDYLCGSKKDYQDATVLVGTTSKIGTGFDQANFCSTYSGKPFDLLILVTSLKKYSAICQNIGRVFRCRDKIPTVMHLVDNDSIFKSHWYKARKWYLKRGATITEHHIKNDNKEIKADVIPIMKPSSSTTILEVKSSSPSIISDPSITFTPLASKSKNNKVKDDDSLSMTPILSQQWIQNKIQQFKPT